MFILELLPDFHEGKYLQEERDSRDEISLGEIFHGSIMICSSVRVSKIADSDCEFFPKSDTIYLFIYLGV